MKEFTLLIGSLLFAANVTLAESPNILFVLVDDLGWSDLGYMGSDLYETPHIDALSEKGIRFMDAYAPAPLCSASRAAILTGWSPARQHLHGVTPHKRTDKTADYESWDVPKQMTRPKAMKVEVPVQLGQLPLSRITIAERLKEKDYATGYFGKWHLGPDADKYPDAQGFDVNIGGSNYGWPPTYFSPYRNPFIEDGPEGEQLTDRLTEEACAFMTRSAEARRPFLCYLSYFTVHGPWETKEEYKD